MPPDIVQRLSLLVVVVVGVRVAGAGGRVGELHGAEEVEGSLCCGGGDADRGGDGRHCCLVVGCSRFGFLGMRGRESWLLDQIMREWQGYQQQ